MPTKRSAAKTSNGSSTPGPSDGVVQTHDTRQPASVINSLDSGAVREAKVTLCIEVGSLTLDTVKAIQAFVEAIANDPAKGASSGPRPASAARVASKKAAVKTPAPPKTPGA